MPEKLDASYCSEQIHRFLVAIRKAHCSIDTYDWFWLINIGLKTHWQPLYVYDSIQSTLSLAITSNTFSNKNIQNRKCFAVAHFNRYSVATMSIESYNFQTRQCRAANTEFLSFHPILSLNTAQAVETSVDLLFLFRKLFSPPIKQTKTVNKNICSRNRESL